jgi:virginiamycin B lyase
VGECEPSRAAAGGSSTPGRPAHPVETRATISGRWLDSPTRWPHVFDRARGKRVGYLDALAFAPVNITNGGPFRLTRGADDSIWFVDGAASSSGRIRADGTVMRIELGEGYSPSSVAVGPGGTAWFTEVFHDAIGHVTGGVVDYCAIEQLRSHPLNIGLGPDGNLWFTERDGGNLSRITPRGVITRFPIAATSGGRRVAIDASQPANLAVGPDSNLRFTDPGPTKIGRMTTTGEVDEFPLNASDVNP